MRGPGAVLYETGRLIVRRATEDDIPGLLTIFGDPENLEHYGTGEPFSREAIRERLIDAYPADDPRLIRAPGLVLQKAGKNVVGFGGVGYYAGGPEMIPEALYVIDRRFVGRGYATEVLRAAIDDAFAHAGIGTIFATVRPENAASIRVLEKSGFAFAEARPAKDRLLYRIDRDGCGAPGSDVSR